MVDLSVNLCGWQLDNPVIPSSGTFGYGYEHKDFYDLNILGSLVLKGTTLNPRFGNPTPRIAECTEGMLISIGLQNPGAEKVISEELPKLSEVFNKKVIANVCGFSAEEYAQVAALFDCCDKVGAMEINVSCPNVNGGMSFGSSESGVYEVTKAVKKTVKKPIFIKLTPNVADIAAIAKAAEEGGADGISLINTSVGMRIDLKSRRPVLGNVKGGFAGRAIFPIALRCVYEVYSAVKIPIIGIGGISSAENVIEMMLAGATAVEVGAENLVNPFACKQIIGDLPRVMQNYGIESISGITGSAHGNF